MIKLLIAFLTITAARANEQLDLKYGLGVFTEDAKPGLVKYFGLSYTNDFMYKPLSQRAELGVWADANSARSSSGIFSYMLGLQVKPSIFYLESFWGMAMITNTDARLSTNFQFAHDLGVGLKDNQGRYLGVTWKHISNAGIQQPNQGRDFILIQVGSDL